MTFDAQRFCNDNQIETSPAGAKHSRPGWVHIRCPFCSGHAGWHGGFNLESGYYNCHRCGGHWMPKVIARLLSSHIKHGFEIISQYSTGNLSNFRYKPPSFDRPEEITLPPDTSFISMEHILYLKDKRGFKHWRQIIRDWDLQSTGCYGNYSYRLLAPIYFEGRVVSFQCRKTHHKQHPPYLACANKNEVIHHKHIVYGFDYAAPLNRCVVVEGITDVWRLGPGAIATFGKKYTPEQLALIANNFKEVFVLMDADAGKEADILVDQLTMLGAKVDAICLDEGDPGALPDWYAKQLMMDLGF
jgi:hypothetical protein